MKTRTDGFLMKPRSINQCLIISYNKIGLNLKFERGFVFDWRGETSDVYVYSREVSVNTMSSLKARLKAFWRLQYKLW